MENAKRSIDKQLLADKEPGPAVPSAKTGRPTKLRLFDAPELPDLEPPAPEPDPAVVKTRQRLRRGKRLAVKRFWLALQPAEIESLQAAANAHGPSADATMLRPDHRCDRSIGGGRRH